jgi:hypothetical protein
MIEYERRKKKEEKEMYYNLESFSQNNYKRFTVELLEKLEERGLIDPAQEREIKQTVNEHLEAHSDEVHIVWMTDDIREVASEKGLSLTDTQLKEMLVYIRDKHDASLGISWDVIGVMLECYLEECENEGDL